MRDAAARIVGGWGAVVRERAVPLGSVALGQVAATLLSSAGDPAALERIRLSLAFASLVVALALSHGIVSSDLRSGRSLRWIQKAISPVGFYLRRWWERTALVMLLIALLTVVTAAWTVLLEPRGAAVVLRGLPTLLLLGVGVSALTYAISGWRGYPDSLLAMALVVVSVFVVLALGPPDGVGRAVLAIAIPLDDVDVLTTFFNGPFPWSGEVRNAALRVLRALGLWLGVGAVGTWFTTRSPLPSD